MTTTTISRHNPRSACRSELTLSEATRSSRNASGCGHRLSEDARRDARWCSPACRQAAYRARRSGRPFDPRRLRLVPELDAPDAAATDRPKSLLPAQTVQLHGPESAGDAIPTPATRALRPVPDAHEHNGRLCATCTVARFREIRPAARARVSAEIVAARIRRDRGEVWGAVNAYGITYEHALRIRRGFRGARRVAETIAYSSRGYSGTATSGSRRNGWSTLPEPDDGLVYDAMLDALAALG